MIAHRTSANFAARRAELLAELFFQEFEPVFILRAMADIGLLMGFSNEKAGINIFAVEIKRVEGSPDMPFLMPRKAFDRLAHSNIPGLLLVADVKGSRLYYAWLHSIAPKSRGGTVPVTLVEIDEAAKEVLKTEFQKVNAGVAAVG